MAQQHDNEIDALLRAIAQRQRREESAQPEGGGTDMSHLDADELAAYVEDSLPAAARERYMAHLAECSQCRSFTVELSKTAPPAAYIAQMQPIDFSPGPIDRFFSLFRLPAMQYGVALAAAVLFVSSLFIVVLRQKREMVAYKEEPEATNPIVPQAQQAQPQQPELSKADSSGDIKTQSATNTAAESVFPTPQTSPEAAVDKLARNATNSNLDATANLPSPAPPPVAEQKTTDNKVVAQNEPLQKEDKTDNFVLGADSAAMRASNADARRAAPLKDAMSSATATAASPSAKREPSRDKQGERGAAITASAEPAKPSNFGYGAGRKAAGITATEKEKAAGITAREEDAETRSFQGRRFRRVDNIWTDSTYQKGKTLMEVRRNSDRSQVLLSREPGLRPYVEEFPGLLIVVWKGTAYKFY
jgi:hypothetical protein